MATHDDNPAGDRSLDDYLAALASDAPTPGGGSVVAVCGALSASLAAMVCRLTFGKSASPAGEEELRSAVTALDSLRRRFLDLAAEDEAAYGRYIAATLLPKGTDTDRTARRQALQHALIGAAEVPLQVATACAALAPQLSSIARIGSRHVLSDVSVATWVAEAALRGAAINVRTNARLMRDDERRGWYQDQASRVETDGVDELSTARQLAAARAHEQITTNRVQEER